MNGPRESNVRPKRYGTPCNCGIPVYQIWSKSYLTAVRRKKVLGYGRGQRPSPRTIQQLVCIFGMNALLYLVQKEVLTVVAFSYRQLLPMQLLSNTNLAAIQKLNNLLKNGNIHAVHWYTARQAYQIKCLAMLNNF